MKHILPTISIGVALPSLSLITPVVNRMPYTSNTAPAIKRKDARAIEAHGGSSRDSTSSSSLSESSS